MTEVLRINSVLTDRVFRIQLNSGAIESVSLPGLMSRLMADEVLDLPAVRHHHGHIVHMFLSQLMALLIESSAPITEEDFREAMLQIDASQETWQIIPKRGEHGFLQPALIGEPPRTKGEIEKQVALSPSDIDFLWFSNKHSMKREMTGQTEIDVWLWQLIATQSGAGGNGPGYFGSFRMNSGTSSRGCWAVYDRSWGVGRRIYEDARMINERKTVAARLHGFAKNGGAALMWTLPWVEGDTKEHSLTTMLQIDQLDIRVLEVTRRINLAIDEGGSVYAVKNTSFQPRSAMAKPGHAAFKAGVCGDIWAPVIHDKDGEKTYSPTATGLSYDQMARLACARATDDEIVYPAPATLRQVEEPVLVATVIAASQGKTEGLYRREITFGDGIEDNPFAQAAIGETAKAMVLDAKAMLRVQRQAMAAYLDKSIKKIPKAIEKKYNASSTRKIDAVFFEHLEAIHLDENDATPEWFRALHDIGRTTLEEMFEAVPVSRIKRMKFITEAENTFYRGFWSNKEKQGFHEWKDVILNSKKEPHHV